MTFVMSEDCLDLLPESGGHVLEFGNKINPISGPFRRWYEPRFSSYTSVDYNGEDGALKLDVREPLVLDRAPFDLVTNFGFSEHVDGQEPFWRNNHHLCAVGGLMIGFTPTPPSSHGKNDEVMYFPTLTFYACLAELNGYETLTCQTLGAMPERKRSKRINQYVFKKVIDSDFVMPPLDMLWRRP